MGKNLDTTPGTSEPERRRRRPLAPAGQAMLLDTLVGLWERSRIGALVLEGSGAVAFANQSARDALRSRTSIRLHKNQLITNRLGLNTLIQRPTMHPGIAKSLCLEDDHLPKSRRLLIVTRLPMRRRADPSVVLLFEPLVTHAPSVSYLREAHQLTATESVVAQRIVAGQSLRDCSSSLDISINTVRTHVKQIFAKCRCRTQAELIRQVALGPAGFIAAL